MAERLIERWFPMAAVGTESLRERTPMTPFPAPNRLHVWWARRPLVASRAAVLASLLPADADRDRFVHALGIHGDPVKARQLMARAVRAATRVSDPYGYPRAFQYAPNLEDQEWVRASCRLADGSLPSVLDPTAGGGSIPFESLRLGFPTSANDLNPVAVLILRATVEWPLQIGGGLIAAYRRLSKSWFARVRPRLEGLYVEQRDPDEVDTTYLWARTIHCPYCGGLIPLAPNWRLSATGDGVRLRPSTLPGVRRCQFEIAAGASDLSEGTVSGGDAKCPYPDCGRTINGDDIKKQAQAGGMGDQLYAVVVKRRVIAKTKTGRSREKWVRAYRAPRHEDYDHHAVQSRLTEAIQRWEANDVVPTERFPEVSNDDRPIQYGMPLWRDLFSPRQLLCHGLGVEVYRELLDEETRANRLDSATKAAFVYLAFALDKLLNYGCRSSRWDGSTGRVRSLFDRHDFAFVSSYGEMAPLAAGLGIEWAVEQTGKCIEELVALTGADKHALPDATGQGSLLGTLPSCTGSVRVTCESAAALSRVEDASIDAVVMDPPYYANVMYAELSDFFYVWLKRTAGRVYPELFRTQLTNKDEEAVANAARFRGQKRAALLAERDYRDRMAAIFAECRRVLKPEGIMTLMFTHKATGAWDALTSGLMQGGFTITASWPVNTEAEGSLHIREKSAANSTIFLVCRPRPAVKPDAEPQYWEDVERLVAASVRQRVEEFQKAGIRGVDLYLASFGPALQEFAAHWPLRRGQPRKEASARRKAQIELFPEYADPYAVTPEDALDAARREVKRWRLSRLTRSQRDVEVDRLTEWFVLAWDAFKAPIVDYDEALHLARVVGLDLDRDVVGVIAEKKGSTLVLLDSTRRAAKHWLGPADGSRSMLDALHHAAHAARSRGTGAAREQVELSGVHKDASFRQALLAVLEVLPVGKAFTKLDEESGPSADAASDFDALETLRRLLLAGEVPKPKQLDLWESPPR